MDLKMLGERIREIRKAKRPKMSGERLAELSKLSVVTIYNLEAGKLPDVKLDTIDRVSRALEVPIGVLTDDSLTVEAMKAQKYLQTLIKQHMEGTALVADSGQLPYLLMDESKKNAEKSSRKSPERDGFAASG